MKDCVSFIVDSILGSKKAQVISETNSSGQIFLTIEPRDENLGRIIGKKGKIINAMRKLIKIRAVKEAKRVIVRIGEGFQNEKGSILAEKEAAAVTKLSNSPSLTAVS